MSRILIISDDQEFAFSLRVLLKRDGHSVMAADDASGGLFRLFADRPRFVVISLRLDTETRKVYRHLVESSETPFLIIGNPSVVNDPELRAAVPADNVLTLPASTRRIWSRITCLLRHPQPFNAADQQVISEPGERRPQVRSPGRNSTGHGERRADRRYRTYERHSRMDFASGSTSSFEIWV